MPKRITEAQKQAVLRMLVQGVDRETIAASVAITPGQVSAVAAHVAVGTEVPLNSSKWCIGRVVPSYRDLQKRKERLKEF